MNSDLNTSVPDFLPIDLMDNDIDFVVQICWEDHKGEDNKSEFELSSMSALKAVEKATEELHTKFGRMVARVIGFSVWED